MVCKRDDAIVFYYAGPGYFDYDFRFAENEQDLGRVIPLKDSDARQLHEGGWNLAWCSEDAMPIAEKYGLGIQLCDHLLMFTSLDDGEKKAKLDALIDRVKDNQCLFTYHIIDEPESPLFPSLARIVEYLREKDPEHPAWINLLPLGCPPEQYVMSATDWPNLAGAVKEENERESGRVEAYEAYLNAFIDIVKPEILSYDKYHFEADGKDGEFYFLNLEMIRRAALKANIPFMNIVQASSWSPHMRVPTPDELRWLTYTTLAYGAHGICHYVYYYTGSPSGDIAEHEGGMADKDGNPTELYYAAKKLNPEFVKIRRQLAGMKSLGAFHAGTVPTGVYGLPEDAPFTPDPPIPTKEYVLEQPVEGVLIGLFGERYEAQRAVIVNLDYKNPVTLGIKCQGVLEAYDAERDSWSPAQHLDLLPGGGVLVRSVRA